MKILTALGVAYAIEKQPRQLTEDHSKVDSLKETRLNFTHLLGPFLAVQHTTKDGLPPQKLDARCVRQHRPYGLMVGLLLEI